eukprot:196115_1
MAPTTYFIGANDSQHIALLNLESYNRCQVCMFIYLHFHNFEIALFLYRNIAKETVGKNDERLVKPKGDVDILLNMLKWHGIKCISSVKCVYYIDSYESMAWTIIVLSARIEKH